MQFGRHIKGEYSINLKCIYPSVSHHIIDHSKTDIVV